MSIYDKASLVLIPSGSKTSKVYSQKPTNGDGDFTFSRSTAATRVNASGNIEKETGNLLLQSNSFDISANWINTFSSETSGQAGYDGTNNAWLLTKTDAGGRIHQNITASGVLTYSVYLKANASNYALIQLNGSGADKYMYIDLTNGNKGSLGGGNIDENIEDVGNGWYRCSITASTDATRVRIYPANSTGDVSATSGSIYIQDAQLEQGLVARDYIETTTTAIYGGITDNVPRLDYTDSSCPALLLEPQRTNLCIQSEYAGSWSTSGTGSVTDNDETSPEGLQNAFTLNDTSSGAYYRIERNVSVSAGDNTLSVFLKKTTGALSHYAGVQLDNTRKYVIIDTTNGTWNEDGSTATNDFIDVEDFSADYWRVIIRNNLSAGLSRVAFWPSISSDGSSIAVGATGENTFYGVQVEAGSYATSYIPTYGSAVTRNVDTYNNTTGIAGLLGSTTGTFFVDMERFNTEDRDASGGTFELRSSNGQTELNIDIEASGSTRAFYRDGGSFNFMYQSSILRGKFCFIYNGSNLKLYHNGLNQFDSATALSANDFSQLVYTGIDGAKLHHQIMLFPTALTDQEAIDLTTI